MVYINFIFTVIAFSLAFLNLLEFKIWSQITYINQIEIFNYFEAGLLVHIPRYFVVLPSFYFGDIFKVNENFVFTIYVILLASLTSLIWIKIQEIIVSKKKYINFSFIIPFILLYFINGRFIFSLFGLSLLLLILVKIRLNIYEPYMLIGFVLSFLFTSVSSGTFSVALLSIIVTSRRAFINYLFAGSYVIKILKILCFAFVFLVLFYLFYLFFNKNLTFYGGGFGGAHNMLSHGLGFILNPTPLLEYCGFDTGFLCSISLMINSSAFVYLLLIFCFLIVFLYFLLYLYICKIHLFAKQLIVVSIVCGVFGFTALMSIFFVAPIFLKRLKIRPDF